MLTIDELAAATGTTARTVRSFQTLGLLDHPELRGRTGQYAGHHMTRLRTILQLQAQGFSLQSLAVLFRAHERGDSLAAVLGLDDDRQRWADQAETDSAELYGFADLQRDPFVRRGATRRGRPLLSVVPTTLWDQTEAS